MLKIPQIIRINHRGRVFRTWSYGGSMRFRINAISLLLCCTFSLFGQQENGKLVFSISEPNLIPEGITYSSKTKSFFLSSINLKKIIEVNAKNGAVTDFISPGAAGYQGGVGLTIDKKRKLLYALCHSKVNGEHITGLYCYALKNKQLQFKIVLDGEGDKILNDMVLDKSGNLYITNTFASKVFILKKGTRELVEFYSEPELYPNGIAIDKKRKILYLASWEKGILALDMETLKTKSIHAQTVNSQKIDGLFLYKNSLIGIHIGGERAEQKIARFYLNKQQQVTKTVLMDKGHPLFDTPTTGVIVKNKFYCIANSQIPKLDQEAGGIKDGVDVTDTYILRYQLKR